MNSTLIRTFLCRTQTNYELEKFYENMLFLIFSDQIIISNLVDPNVAITDVERGAFVL